MNVKSLALQATVNIHDKQWQVSVATTLEELTQGLGGLPSIPANTGMLFDLGYETTITVTTEPMLFPIDIAFISSSLVIVDIARDIQPGCLITSDVAARYFLEVNAGELSGIAIGDAVVIQGAQVQPNWTSSLMSFGMAAMMIGLAGAVVVGMVRSNPGNPTSSYPKPGESGQPAAKCPRCGSTNVAPIDSLLDIAEPGRVARLFVCHACGHQYYPESMGVPATTALKSKKKVVFIGSCKVSEGYCLTHGYAVRPTVRCSQSQLTDEEWKAAWELAETAWPEGMHNPWVNGWWPETLDEAERTVENYARSMRDAVRKYREIQWKAMVQYETAADKAIYNYRQYVMREYERRPKEAIKAVT